MDAAPVKEEIVEYTELAPVVKAERPPTGPSNPVEYIDLSSSSDSDFVDSDDSDGDDDDDDASGKRTRVSEGDNGGGSKKKKQKLANLSIALPLGFLQPLPREETPPPMLLPQPEPIQQSQGPAMGVKGSKQFWKAGDYDDSPSAGGSSATSTAGMDHARVHPKFLHSNATSHKWALGAFAELLDNSLDEVCYGATFVNIDMIENKDRSRMLLIEDNGGGMSPDKMRQCMSLGYSAKSKLANVIGQYGNGFKTSTMRLGADVIVFTRCRGKDSKSPTQSIGLLSYTFLKSTGKEDIVVPMIDYEKGEQGWNKLIRSSVADWNKNAETIVQWSPYSSEAELSHQFNNMNDQGTRIIIYNLWEDDQGELELDFTTDRHDIQIRGGNRDEKKIEMAKQFPNSRHFLTYRHSLRSYASILYLRRPPGFRIVLRGKDVEHHNIVNDLMLTQEITYRPTGATAEGLPKDPNMIATVTIGFVKDAKDHIDVQGFNVYHKNRLIKPFWRVWNPAGSDGRGVIGVLEANFVEPAHDKQGFERTTVLLRLESRLIQMQKTYWSSNCHKIGYAPRGKQRTLNLDESTTRESSPEYSPHQSSRHSNKSNPSGTGHVSKGNGKQSSTKFVNKSYSSEPTSSFAEDDSDCEIQTIPPKRMTNGSVCKPSPAAKTSQRNSPHYTQSSSRSTDNGEAKLDHASNGRNDRILTRSQLKAIGGACNGDALAPCVNTSNLNNLEEENCRLRERIKEVEDSYMHDLEVERKRTESLEVLVNEQASSSTEASSIIQLTMENRELKDRIKKKEESLLHDLQFEKDRCRSLEAQLQESQRKIEEMNKEQEALIDIFAEERNRRANEEDNLRKKLKEASSTIQTLLDKVRLLEKMKSPNFKPER